MRVMGIEATGARWQGRVTYHDCCHLLRELNVSSEPRALMRNVEGIEILEMDRPDACCGFGGTFSVKYPEISAAIAEEKVASISRSGADTVVAGSAVYGGEPSERIAALRAAAATVALTS